MNAQGVGAPTHAQASVRVVLAIAAAATTGILVGASMVATRFVVHQTDPVTLALLRYIIGVLCLAPAVLLAQPVRFAWRDLMPISLLGVGQFGVLVVLMNFGLQHIGSGLGAILFATLPLLTLLLAASLRVERLTAAKVVGAEMTMVGVSLTIGHEIADSSGSQQVWIGSAAILLSAATGAVCSVLYRPYLLKYPPLHLGALAMLASAFALAIAVAVSGGVDRLPSFDSTGWLVVVFIGASSGLGYFLWLWALRAATPTRVTIFLALSPITAAALGNLILGEPVSALFVAGLVSVSSGLAIAHWQSERQTGQRVKPLR